MGSEAASGAFRDASAVLADLSWLLESCDPETILHDPDPEKLMKLVLAEGLEIQR